MVAVNRGIVSLGVYEIVVAGLLCIGSSTAAAADNNPNLEEIVVTASPIAGNVDRFATIVGQVSRRQILESGGANIANALVNVPGVTGTGFAAGASRPVIRGMGASRVRVLEDGIGSFDVSDIGPDHGVPIDPLSAQKIEVVRGAATLRYGSQAIGGVVNAINNRVPMSLPDKPFAGEVTASYGSDAATGQGSALVDAQLGQFAVHADGFVRHSSDYDTPRGIQFNSYNTGHGLSGGASYFFDNGSHVGAAVIHYDARYGIPSDVTFIDMKQTKFLERSSFNINLGPWEKLSVDGGYGDYLHNEVNPDGSIAATFKDRGWGSRAEAVFGKMGFLSDAALGVQVQSRNFSALGDAASYLLPTSTESAAGYMFAEAPISPSLNLQMAARVESVTIHGSPSPGAGMSLRYMPVSGSVGVLYDASKQVKLGLTLTSAARTPAVTELFARGPHDGPGTFETGDPNLTIERANSVEGTLRVRLPRMRFDGSVWVAGFDNFIYGRLSGRTCSDAHVCVAGNSQPLRELFYDQRGATFWGAEGKETLDLFQAGGGVVQGHILGDYVRATLNSDGNVPRIPPYHVGLGLSWQGASVETGAFLKYTARQDQIAAAETPTPAFVSLDAHVNCQPLASYPGLQVSLVGHNLTDTVQRDAVSLNKDQVIMPGRDIRLIMDVTF